ncbi:MAG: hypothetical protein QNL87_02295 [Gammaproteobacteria bacterium]|nr:hypothetical protein [Gammaproteobacteria bacterium]
MLQLIRAWFDICLLRRGPQDLPAARFFLGFSLGCYALVSLLVAAPSFGVTDAARLAVVDTGMLAGFVTLLLYLKSKTERINQALSALAGSGCLMGLFALPLVLLVDPGQPADQVPALLGGFWLLLLIWNLFVMAHVMRHALSTSFAIGLGAAVLYALVSMQIVATLFPQQVV